MTLEVQWFDRGFVATKPADPRYPIGMDIVEPSFDPEQPSCSTALKWPAPRCGHHVVLCDTCGKSITVTTAGRLDDPRSLKINCKPS